MTEAKTLLELAGADLVPARVSDAVLVLIDFQNEYRSGPIAVANVESATASAADLLASARRNGAPVIHVAHKGRPGGLFDRDAERGRIMDDMAPLADEPVVEKGLPNAFADTNLRGMLAETERREVVLAGFMTHMCISATARAALDLGYRATVDASSCGTRDLPDGRGGVIPAATVHDVALVELSDRFAVVAWDAEQVRR